MALINCIECGQRISSAAKSCPHCGCPVAERTNDTVTIKIEQNPVVLGELVTIKEEPSKRILIKNASSGSVVEIKTEKEITIGFYGLTPIPMFIGKVSPKKGGKYKATWGTGFFSPKIVSCSKVDIIDS